MIPDLKSNWNKPLTNAWISSPSAWNVEIIASSGYDLVTIDAQHGLANDLTTIVSMLQAVKQSPALAFVRLPWNDPAYIMRMLDAGVYGLICPMLNNATETEAFVKAAKYYPDGIRSIGPTRASVVYGDRYLEEANKRLVTMAMIETPEALKDIKEIVKVENLDGLYVGPWDLSMSLGYRNVADFNDPTFIDILKRIVDTAKEHGLHCGIHAGSPHNGIKFVQMGYDMVTIINDSSALKTIAKNTLSEFQKSPENSSLSGY